MDGVKGEDRLIRYPEEVPDSEILYDDDTEDIKGDEFGIACDSDTRRRVEDLGVREEGIFLENVQ